MSTETDVAIAQQLARIANSLGTIEGILQLAFPPADTRPLAERAAEATSMIFDSLTEDSKRAVANELTAAGGEIG